MSVFVVALIVIGPSPAAAQDINDAVTFEDLGFTDRLAVGARAAGMAGAFTAASDDVYALFYNPAGLARLRRIDISIGFELSSAEVKSVFYGNPGSTDLSATTLDAFAAAYPIPTYRGSLVIAGGVYRMFTSDLDLLNTGTTRARTRSTTICSSSPDPRTRTTSESESTSRRPCRSG